ncbi:MAG TPA: DUF1761 domain-containing protein [Terriglobales bacterium]|nr:DUF1761 domain-containing protein [Terriglobales bacterium]
MYMLTIPIIPVLVAAVSTLVIGFIWYSPMLFARPWMLAMGYDPEDKAKLAEMRKGAGMMYAIAFIASVVSAFVLAKFILVTTVNTAAYGMKVAFAIWLGFVTTVQLTSKLFERKPFKLYLINTGYQLVCYLVMGIILAVWR